jgi:DNA polymerase-3 subunit delta'
MAAGTHADLLFSEADATTGALKIEEIRTVAGKLALKPFEARYRVAIFRDFDRAQPRAQDALLKTLEEPPPYALLMLLARSGENLLPTITSRSQVLNLRPVSAGIVRDALVEHWGAEAERATLLARLSAGRIGWAVRALQDPGLLDQRGGALELLNMILTQNRAGRFDSADDLGRDKLSLAPLLELWQTYWRDVVLLREGSRLAPANYDRMTELQQLADQLSAEGALKALTATTEMISLLQVNVNVRLALETMLLNYPGL